LNGSLRFDDIVLKSTYWKNVIIKPKANSIAENINTKKVKDRIFKLSNWNPRYKDIK
jgi:hypothetical protein